jgi:hypothetical protein
MADLDNATMDLICYLHPGWAPLIRPASATRAWMDATPESFAYRCLPLNIANAHGWELLVPRGFDASWDGGIGPNAITIRFDGSQGAVGLGPVSLFGQGVITFHIEGIFRTPPGWNLWVGGSPNRGKDGIYPLSGVIETDWSPFTFTMNWRFTRPDHWVHFGAMEPFGFVFPVQRAAIESFKPRFEPLDSDHATQTRFAEWSQARDEFHRRMAETPPNAPAAKWQKHYYRGVDVAGQSLIADHRSKLRLPSFDVSATPDLPAAPLDDLQEDVPSAPTVEVGRETKAQAAELVRAKRDLDRREWLLEAMERQRSLSQRASQIERREGLNGQAFLDEFYAPSRPVVLTGEMDGWPALTRWTAEYLKAAVGPAPVEYQQGRTQNAQFELEKELHRSQGAFTDFIDLISRPGAGNYSYMTAYNSAANAKALAPLCADLGFFSKFLTHEADQPKGMIWIGSEGLCTSLHHDLTNNFIAQVVGRKHFKLLPANQVGKLYNHVEAFSEIADLDTVLDFRKFPRLMGARAYDVILEPGEILFLPLAWWHQAKAIDFNVTLTYTNFIWPNDAHSHFPVG